MAFNSHFHLLATYFSYQSLWRLVPTMSYDPDFDPFTPPPPSPEPERRRERPRGPAEGMTPPPPPGESERAKKLWADQSEYLRFLREQEMYWQQQQAAFMMLREQEQARGYEDECPNPDTRPKRPSAYRSKPRVLDDLEGYADECPNPDTRPKRPSAYRSKPRVLDDLEDLSLEDRDVRTRYMQDLRARDQEILALKQSLAEKNQEVKGVSLKATRYNGTGDLEDYLAQFSSIATFNRWGPNERVAVLLSKLEGDALKAAAVLVNPTYDQLILQLRECFSPERQDLASLKLQSRIQGKDETLEALSLDIQKLTAKAYPTADGFTQNRLAKDAFINAIQDPAIRERLRDKNTQSLRECLSEARRIETNIQVEKSRAGVQASSGRPTRQVHVVDAPSSSQPKPGASKDSQPKKPASFQRRVPTCYNCTRMAPFPCPGTGRISGVRRHPQGGTIHPSCPPRKT